MKYSILFSLLLICCQIKAATNTAASASRADVGTAYALCSAGDTLVIPAGNAAWTNTLHATNIIIRGAGTNLTVITDAISDDTTVGGTAIIHMHSTSNSPTQRITGISFQEGTRVTDYIWGAIQLTGTGKAARIDNCHFWNLNNRDYGIFDFVVGVGDSNTHWNDAGHQAMLIYHNGWADGTYADKSWSTDVNWGTTNEGWYVESCIFTNGNINGPVYDLQSGGRIVFRYNTVINSHLDSHGTESGNRYRGVRSSEVYGNSISNITGVNYIAAIYCRGGTHVVSSNTISGYNSLIALANYRNFFPFTPWGGANGTNDWDTNTTTLYDTGTHTGAANATSLTSSGQGWTVNQWVGYSINNISLTNWNNSGHCGYREILANTADTITYFQDTTYGTNLVWQNGDTFEIRKVVAALDQVGRSTGDAISGDTPTPRTWPNQALEPVYEWGNTQNGAANYELSSPGSIAIGTEAIEDTEKPAYTRLVFPYPLITAQAEPAPASKLHGKGPLHLKGPIHIK